MGVGEQLVILKPLEHDVKARFILKDTGKDLIAARSNVIDAIQVESTVKERWTGLPIPRKMYHTLHLYFLLGNDKHLEQDE